MNEDALAKVINLWATETFGGSQVWVQGEVLRREVEEFIAAAKQNYTTADYNEMVSELAQCQGIILDIMVRLNVTWEELLREVWKCHTVNRKRRWKVVEEKDGATFFQHEE